MALRKYIKIYIKPMSNRKIFRVDTKYVYFSCYFNKVSINVGYNNWPNLISYISTLHQLDFYKDVRLTSLNKRIKYFQIIHAYI